MTRCSCCPRDPSDLRSFKWHCSEQPETSVFCSSVCSASASCHDIWIRQAHVLQVWYSSFWWLSGEVQHIVHLIRWNLKAVLCQLGQDLTTVPVKGIIARTVGLGTESCESCCFTNCFGFPVCHQLVPHLVPNSPACFSVMCRGV